MSRQPLVGRLLLITEASPSHSVGLFWKSDQPVGETFTWQNTKHSEETDLHTPGENRTLNPSKRAAADTPLRLHGHWARLTEFLTRKFKKNCNENDHLDKFNMLQGLLHTS